MRGMWSSDKSVNTAYRPGIDSLKAIDSAALRDAIVSAVDNGAGITFSSTRDFGAICITLLNGNERPKVYCTSAQELNQALLDLVDSLSPTPPPTGKRAR